MARSKKKMKVDEKIEDLNLVPIMNLVVCLIPMVLVGMSLVKIGVINVNAPRFGMGQAEPSDDEDKPLGLTIAIAEDGFRLTATGADINAELGETPTAPAAADAPPQPGVFIPKSGEVYNYSELYNKLVKIKEGHPDETIVNMTADAKIPFKYVIAVMDTMRFELEQKSYSDAKDFTAASIMMDRGQQKLLWPDVVFAVARQ
ncbi:MAG: biopolymer transporter ExbD [bacterium]|nr:biopolymer transporter ExbD [Myxococcales bacterium]MCB9552602.1 biopolymer transporter ExbD [Myxococcales bacterium]